MLTRTHHTRTRFLQVADGLFFAFAVALAYGLRAVFPFLDLPELETFDDYLWLLLLMGLTGPLVLSQQGFYRPASLQTRGAAIFTIIQSCAYTVLALVIFLFIVRVQFARSVIMLGGVFAVLLIYARHEFTQKFAAGKITQAELHRRVLWIGVPTVVTRLQANLTPVESEALIHTVTLDPGTADINTVLPQLLHTHAINLVLLSLPQLPQPIIPTVIEACEREGVELILHPGLPVASPFRLSVDQIGGEPVLYYRAHGARPTDLFTKQVSDYLGASLILLILSPVLLFIAVLVRISSPGPVIYRQPRAGLNGRTFTMYKFRSMNERADELKSGLAGQNEMDGPVFKMTNDPRVTRLGRSLRRHSLDELPQLWNVLRGEMSLVGPRPLPVEEVHRFDNFAHRRRLSMKPGLTCLWQVRGRNEITSFEEWVRLDLEYIDQWSLWLDLKILLATIPVTLFGRGGR